MKKEMIIVLIFLVDKFGGNNKSEFLLKFNVIMEIIYANWHSVGEKVLL